MPNWVDNSVFITGTEEQIADIKEFLGKKHFMSGDDEIPFNFANLISIPEDKLEEYHVAHGFADGKQIGDTEFNWYNWNNRCWGTKWNACDGHEETYPNEIMYYFNTAWSVPEGIVQALANKLRGTGMTFTWNAEEEQGWGVEYDFDGNELHIVAEWDIPVSHADHKARGKDCRCEWSGDPEYRFFDCPEAGKQDA